MTKHFWIEFFEKPRPLTKFELFCFENRIDEIASKRIKTKRDEREINVIIMAIEESLRRLTKEQIWG